MSKFLTRKEISLKLFGYAAVDDPLLNSDRYLTKSQVVSQYSNEDYDETKLNNVKGDNYFVTDDDIVQSPRYALHVNLDDHVQSVTISVSESGEHIKPISDNTSDDNDVSPSSLSGGTIIDPTIPGGGTIIDPTPGGVEFLRGNFIKIGKEKTITAKNSTVYIPAGAGVNFSAKYDVGYKGDLISNIFSMDRETTVNFTSTENTTTHTHKNSGTVHVTFNKHNTQDILSYQVYHTYNNSNCTIQTGDINGTSATITTPTYGNTNILFYSSQGPASYKMRVNSSSNVTATAFQSNDLSTEVQYIGPTLGLIDIKSGWSVNITIY